MAKAPAPAAPATPTAQTHVYVYSTLTAAQAYQADTKRGQVWMKEGPEVIIEGGHGLTVRKASGAIETPRGVVTKITQEQLSWLMKCNSFKAHQAAGFVLVDGEARDPEKVISADMQTRSGDAQLSMSQLGTGETNSAGRIIVKTDEAESLIPA